MNLYKRHEAECQYKNGSGKDKDRSKRCGCSIYIEWNLKGKQNRRRVKQYESLIKAVDRVPEMTGQAIARVKALMMTQRYAGLSLVDAVMLSKEELVKDGDAYRIVTDRQKSGEPVNNVIPASLAKELLTVKNGNPEYFFGTGEATPKSAVSYFDKLYRKAFKQAGIKTDGQLSHRLRHTYAVELLKAGVDIRKVSKALGHASVTTTERYYAKWNRAQQDTLDAALSGAF